MRWPAAWSSASFSRLLMRFGIYVGPFAEESIGLTLSFGKVAKRFGDLGSIPEAPFPSSLQHRDGSLNHRQCGQRSCGAARGSQSAPLTLGTRRKIASI